MIGQSNLMEQKCVLAVCLDTMPASNQDPETQQVKAIAPINTLPLLESVPLNDAPPSSKAIIEESSRISKLRCAPSVFAECKICLSDVDLTSQDAFKFRGCLHPYHL